jgi:site-specific DNA recombinase
VSQPAVGEADSPKRAVVYLRVSTPRQMNTAIDIDPEGNSIATQRESCLAKAHSLDASVVAEFVEPGNSAQSIEKRPVFKQLLAYLEEHRDVDYVIVYMRSRAFRNSIDAAITKRALSMFGIRIVSCKEDFGTGPVADAMETVSDAFNELQVRQNGEDIKLKLRHKALGGGTISRAKLGYLNTRAEHEGRLFNSIGLDDKRAPLVLKVFELYSTGEYSIDLLEITMTDLGLTTRPSGRWPREQSVSASKLHRMLSDPYYAGWVSVDGDLIRGRHEAIVSQALFDRVQDVLDARSRSGQRDRVLTHYLKGLLYCDRCYSGADERLSRLIYTEAKGRNGCYYGYYLCRSRQDGQCNLPHLPVDLVEEAIRRNYTYLHVPEDFAAEVRDQLDTAMSNQQSITQQLHDSLTKQLAKLEGREERLIDLAADGVLTKAKIQHRSNAIQVERQRIQSRLADTTAELELGAQRLRDCLALIGDPARLYEQAPDDVRRHLNQTFYQKFFVDDDLTISVTRDVLNPPFDEIHEAARVYERQALALRNGAVTSLDVGKHESWRSLRTAPTSEPVTPVLADLFSVHVSSKRVMVEPRRLELLTLTLPA